MGGASLPKTPSPGREVPNLLDPTVMFARQRERDKAAQAQGRRSTILSSGSAFQPGMKLGAAV